MRELRLYDVAPLTAGVAADLSHIATGARVSAHTGPQQLADALYGADLVVIPAGVPRKPGMTRDDLFKINAGARSRGAGQPNGVARWQDSSCCLCWSRPLASPTSRRRRPPACPRRHREEPGGGVRQALPQGASPDSRWWLLAAAGAAGAVLLLKLGPSLRLAHSSLRPASPASLRPPTPAPAHPPCRPC